MEPSIERIADLQQFVADFSKVTRVPLLSDTNRLENDVDHSYGLALTCWYLAPKIAPDLNLEKIFKYALSHDIVELHAGDTFVFADTAEVASKSEREDAAIETLYEEWPDFSEMVDYAKGYKEKIDEEAKFVKAVDKILPLIIIEQGEGSDFWNRHKITLDMERKNKVTILVSDYVAPYYDQIIVWLEERGNMHKPKL
ncbi:MAG TPA: HD domain-containing protein [Candidatus Saccharimonadales bacterium]|nr:HD domain-containing protein [Candidatus Saccharimonadales bacterium]